MFQSIISNQNEAEFAKQQAAQDKRLIAEFTAHLRKFERLFRVFEMTYLDMSNNLREVVKDKNLASKPLEVQQEVKINQKGQIIAEDYQLFDNKAFLIDKQSNITKREVSNKNRPQQQTNSSKYVST